MNCLGEMSGVANQKPLGTVWHKDPPRLSACMQGTFQTFHPGESRGGFIPVALSSSLLQFTMFLGKCRGG